MREGFDATGTVMGLLTIPMALLTAGGIVAGVLLAARQDWPPILLGLAAFAACTVLARLLEQLVIRIDDVAALALGRRRRGIARVAASVSGVLPVGVILLCEVVTLHEVLAMRSQAPTWLVWLWGYGAATAPWTLYAQQVGRFRRTLVGIRAYAGHLALWLFSMLALWWQAPAIVTIGAMLLPALLPVTVGFLLALADREAIRNVRV